MYIPLGLEFNYGKKLDQLIHTIAKFGYSFEGITEFKDLKGKRTKAIGISKNGKSGGYQYLKKDDIDFLNNLVEGMFYNLKYYGCDSISVYFYKTNL